MTELDDRDWEIRRSRKSLSSSDTYLPLEWTPNPDTPQMLQKRQDAANRLNAMVSAAGYANLTDDARRVLANLPGNELAFSQLTVEPLDPDNPATANARGPDDPDNFTIDDPAYAGSSSTLRRHIDILDGGSSNAYFYRVAAVDGAQNRSALSLSTPPVYCPDATPPRAPVITKILAGDPDPAKDQNRKITLRWASNREPDLAEYRIYRANNKEDARDLRLMMLVHTVSVPTGSPTTRPTEMSWTDFPIPGLVTFYYRLVSVDNVGNVSDPSPTLVMRAFDESLPVVPSLIVGWSAPVPPAKAEVAWTSNDWTRLERRAMGDMVWDAVGDWRSPGTYTLSLALDVNSSWRFRLRVKKETNAQTVGPIVPLTHL
jgi:hypothetical protein